MQQEIMEAEAREALWREELIEEIEQKVGGLKELEEAGKKEELVKWFLQSYMHFFPYVEPRDHSLLYRWSQLKFKRTVKSKIIDWIYGLNINTDRWDGFWSCYLNIIIFKIN